MNYKRRRERRRIWGKGYSNSWLKKTGRMSRRIRRVKKTGLFSLPVIIAIVIAWFVLKKKTV